MLDEQKNYMTAGQVDADNLDMSKLDWFKLNDRPISEQAVEKLIRDKIGISITRSAELIVEIRQLPTYVKQAQADGEYISKEWDLPRDERNAEHIKNMVLEIIDKYRNEVCE